MLREEQKTYPWHWINEKFILVTKKIERQWCKHEPDKKDHIF